MARIVRRRPLTRARHTVERGRRPVEAAVVMLHGGPERGFRETPRWSAPYLRLRPFGRRIRELSDDRIAIVRVQHTQTGWNGGERTTLAQARLVLADLTERRPDLTIGLLGHSLGGRTALAAADHDKVRSVVALAPWVTPYDDVQHLVGCDVLVVQGERDRVCPPRDSEAFVARLRAAGGSVEYAPLAGCGHAMIRRAGLWHELAASFLVRTLLASESPLEPPPESSRH